MRSHLRRLSGGLVAIGLGLALWVVIVGNWWAIGVAVQWVVGSTLSTGAALALLAGTVVGWAYVIGGATDLSFGSDDEE
jgi:hypothetical protein